VATQIDSAHDSAVADVIGWLEREVAYTRTGRAGARQVPVRGLLHRPRPVTFGRTPVMTTTTQKPLPTYVSLVQAAEITEQSVRTIRRRISDGSLPAYKFGPRHIRIKLEDLEAMARRIASARS